MVYVRIYDLSASIKKCELDIKYPNIKSNAYANYMDLQLSRYNNYQRLGRRLIALTRKYIRNQISTIPEFIDKYFIKDMTMFKIYYKSDIKDFRAYAFVEKFTGKTVTDVLEIFSYCNYKQDVSYLNNSDVDIGNALKKIFDAYLLMELAKIFAVFDFTNKANFMSETFFNTNIKIKKCLTNGIDMDKYTDTNSKFMNSLNLYDNQKEKAAKLINNLYDAEKTVYQFLKANSVAEVSEQCKKIPDLDAIIGRYYHDKKTVSSTMICKYVINVENIYLHHLVSGCVENMINNADQLSNFKLPSDEPVNKMLVIDI